GILGKVANLSSLRRAAATPSGGGSASRGGFIMRPLSGLMSLSVLLGLAIAPAARGQVLTSGPWKLATLQQPPNFTWVDTAGPLRRIFYEGEPFLGRPTRVFAYYAEPALALGPLPAVVLVHGGGGTAFPEWARQWANRGYVALAMDLGGRGPDGN